MTATRRWRVAAASAASAAMLIAAPLVGAQIASAQPYPPSTAVHTNSDTVTAGGLLSFDTRPGLFHRDRGVTALLESTPIVLGHFPVRTDGSVAGTVRMPVNAVHGWHVFRLTEDGPDVSIGVTIWVEGGVTGTPSPTPTPTPTHTRHPRPSHEPTHPGRPEHHGHDDGHSGSHGRTAVGEGVGYQHTNQHPHQNGKSLAATGSDTALALGGVAAALFTVGGSAMLAVRRRRSS